MKKYSIGSFLVLIVSMGWANETNSLKRFETDLRNSALVDHRPSDIDTVMKKCQAFYNLADSEIRAVLMRVIGDGLREGTKQPNLATIRAIKAIGNYGNNETGLFLLTIADSERLRPIRSVALCSYLKMQSDEDFAAKVKEIISENPKYDKSLRYAVVNWVSAIYYDKADERRKKDIIQTFHRIIHEEKNITNFTGLDEFLREKDAEYAKSEERFKLLKSHSRKIEKKNASDIYVEEELKWFDKERPKKETAIPNISIQI
ncbi:MAG: hypothetical protein WCP12_13550 [bacterium]